MHADLGCGRLGAFVSCIIFHASTRVTYQLQRVSLLDDVSTVTDCEAAFHGTSKFLWKFHAVSRLYIAQIRRVGYLSSISFILCAIENSLVKTIRILVWIE